MIAFRDKLGNEHLIDPCALHIVVQNEKPFVLVGDKAFPLDAGELMMLSHSLGCSGIPLEPQSACSCETPCSVSEPGQEMFEFRFDRYSEQNMRLVVGGLADAFQLITGRSRKEILSDLGSAAKALAGGKK